MRLQFVTIGQNLKWPRGGQVLRQKKTLKGIYDSPFSSSNKARASESVVKYLQT